MTSPNFEGHAGRECGEHRTTGSRAWCHNCSEWCYPDSPCKGCELPQLRATVATLTAERDELRRELGWHGASGQCGVAPGGGPDGETEFT